MRKEIPLVLGSAVGFLFVIEYFFKVPALSSWAKMIQQWVVVISAFMMGLGAANLLRIHSRAIAQRKKNWISSALLIVSLLAMFISGAFGGQSNPFFKALFDYLYDPLGSTAFALLIFYATTVIFRSFRLRDPYTVFFMLSAAVVMFGRSPLGETVLPASYRFADWIFKIPNLAGQRGIVIGSAIGAVTVGLRVILGMERKYLGE